MIQRGQAQLLPPRQIQVRSVVGCQPVVARKPERLLPFHLNREPP